MTTTAQGSLATIAIQSTARQLHIRTHIHIHTRIQTGMVHIRTLTHTRIQTGMVRIRTLIHIRTLIRTLTAGIRQTSIQTSSTP